jgi:hypothetical protein
MQNKIGLNLTANQYLHQGNYFSRALRTAVSLRTQIAEIVETATIKLLPARG